MLQQIRLLHFCTLACYHIGSKHVIHTHVPVALAWARQCSPNHDDSVDIA